MNSCEGCKYNKKTISPWKNWCFEPTHPNGTVVYTTGDCDKHAKGSLLHILPEKKQEQPKPKNRVWTTNTLKHKSIKPSQINRNDKKVEKYLKTYFPGTYKKH